MEDVLWGTLNAGLAGDDAGFQAGLRQIKQFPGIQAEPGDTQTAGRHMRQCLKDLNRKRFLEADQHFRNACAASPHDFKFRETYVAQLMRQKQYGRAHQAAWDALVLEPRNPGLWLLFGRSKACLGWERDGTVALAVGMATCPIELRKRLLDRHRKAGLSPAERRAIHELVTRWNVPGL